MPTDDAYRLPRHVLPRRYELALDLDLRAATFAGTVLIDVEVVERADRVTLNSVDLNVIDVTVEVGDGTVPVTVEPDAQHERIHLVLSSPLAAGHARLHLRFTGTLDTGLLGLYRSTFTVDGRDRTVAVTQFESTHARRAFPCFDEPDMKAVFSIELVVDEDLLAVSNAAEVQRSPVGDGRVAVRFADTMVMSTYLVAIVVGPLEATEARMVRGRAGPIPLRVVHPPGTAHLSGFALEVADAGIRFLEEYYDLPYPGDKIDLVAVPDFAFGAMENLGCITFREVLLLVDPDRATPQELQRVADVINHELAHMWFGDLVTMDWWNGIWLNEAFATFMEISATDAFRPEWDCWTAFGLARAQAFDTDALGTTRPIEFPVHSPADAEAMFDILTYEKGASVVRMLEQYLGADRFRAGIAAYLRRHAYANTDTTDLWDALEESTGEPVRRIMDAWIFRGGHPVVEVSTTGTGVHLDQRPARSVGPGGPPADGDTADGAARWPVPVVLSTAGDAGTDERRILVDGPIDIDLGGRPRTARVNTAGSGFFRTALSEPLRTAEIADGDATALERFVLVDDTWAGFLRAEADIDQVLRLLRLASWRETDPSVWRRLAGAVRDVHRLLGRDHGDMTVELARDVASAPFGHVTTILDGGGLDGGGLDGTVGAAVTRWQDVRGILLSVLAVIGDDGPSRAMAREVFHHPPGNRADSALRAAALDVVASTGGQDDHRAIEDRWRNTENPQDRIRYLHALADTPVPTCFARTLALATTEVRSQDAAFLLRRALSHPDLGGQAWEHVTTHWDAILDRLPSSSLPRLLEGIRGIVDPAHAEDVTEFVGGHPLPSGDRVVAQHVERMWVTVAASARARAHLRPGTG